MEVSDKIAAMKHNVPHTTGGGSGGGAASREGITPMTRDLPLWSIEKKGKSVERDGKTWN